MDQVAAEINHAASLDVPVPLQPPFASWLVLQASRQHGAHRALGTKEGQVLLLHGSEAQKTTSHSMSFGSPLLPCSHTGCVLSQSITLSFQHNKHSISLAPWLVKTMRETKPNHMPHCYLLRWEISVKNTQKEEFIRAVATQLLGMQSHSSFPPLPMLGFG